MTIQYEDFKNRFRKKYKHLKKWADRNNITAWRVYDRDIPQYPFAIDIYNNHCHFQVFTKSDDPTENSPEIDACRKIVAEITKIPIPNIRLKNRMRQAGREQYQKLHTNRPDIIITENKRKFIVNLDQYLDTGLFLDHRNLRKIVAENARDKSILNLFSYTASFSVYAATAGAKNTLSVDLSNTYTRWAENNFKLNGMNPENNILIATDAVEYLKNRANAQDRHFDIIVLDPPSFSNSKKTPDILDIQKDHTILIQWALKCLAPGGIIYFSTNLKTFKFNPELADTTRLTEITTKTVPEDFKNSKPHRAWKIRPKP